VGRPRVEVSVEMRVRDLPLPVAKLRRDAAAAVAAAGFRGALSLAVVSDATMRRVNRQFHATDEPTDVLAFPLGGGDGAFDAEVVVSLDTARREAHERGVDPAAELMLYVVHGVLHLLGFDDHAKADARRMHARTLSILADLGYDNTIEVRAKAPDRVKERERSKD
jgi:probable rRNA maturation factor